MAMKDKKTVECSPYSSAHSLSKNKPENPFQSSHGYDSKIKIHFKEKEKL